MSEKKLMRFKVVSGCHRVVERNADGTYKRGEDGQLVKRTYRRGEVIESEFNLVQKFGPKFKRLGKYDPEEDDPEEDSDVTQPEDDGLDAKTDDELRQLAEELELDVSKAKSRKSLLKVIREATASV